jgi:glyoxylase-like metal-dependent hydrolase (beta-lactamase superfamily II)
MARDLTPASWFATFEVKPGLLLFQEKHYWEWNRSNLWLIRGRDRDLLVDAGLGVASLRRHVLSLGLREPSAVATHAHFDHAGGLSEFPERCIHEAEGPALSSGDGLATLTAPGLGWIRAEHFARPPSEGFDARGYRFAACEPTRRLREGDVLDLGDTALEVLHLPGHSPGSTALWDPVRRELFPGDVAYDGELLDALPGSDAGAYLHSCERLLSLPAETVYPGHYRVLDGGELRAIARGYLDAHRGP